MFTEYSKMFDPQSFAQQWQKAMDMNQAMSTGKKSMETFQQVSSMWADTFNSCAEKQMKMCQTAMEDSIECMRELSTMKGMDDYMSKQAEWTRKWTEKYQSSAQDIAETVQKTQTKCSDMISKMMMSGDWSKASK